MHHFAIVFTKSYDARSTLIRRLAKGIDHLVPYVPKQMHAISLADNAIFISTENHDFLNLGAHHLQQGRDFIAYEGFCQRSDRQTQTSNIFLNAFREYGPFLLNDSLHGEFCAAHFNSGTNCLSGVTDFTGLRPIYYMDSSEYFAISNRQMFLNPLLTSSEKISIDFREVADLLGKGNKFSDRSMLQGVRMLRPGFAISYTCDSGTKISRSGTPIFQDRGEPSKLDYIKSVHEIVRNFDALENMPGLDGKPIRISLTGGEDSRLVLAAALESRIADRIETFTYGFADNPDIAAAEIVAKKAGVPHTKTIYAMPTQVSERPIGDIWRELKQHAFRFEGAPGAWDGGGGSATQTRLDLVGYFDAYFKRVRPLSAEIDVTSRDVARAAMREPQQPFDPLGFLTPAAVDWDADFCNSWMESVLDDGAELNDIPELFYFDFRLPWWGGGMAANVGSLYRMAPLASKLASRTGLKQTVTDRRERKFIFQAMLALRPDLLEIPYLNKKWPDHFQGMAGSTKLPEKEMQIPTPQHPSAPWQVTLARRDGEFIHEYLMSHDFSGLEEVINLKRLTTFLTDKTLIKSGPIVRSIVNLCEILVLAANDQSRAPDRIGEIDTDKINLTTNISELANLGSQKKNYSTLKNRRNFNFNFPSSSVKNARIDPASCASEMLLYSVSLQKRDGSKLMILPSCMRHNSEMSAKLLPNGVLHLKSIGNDPQILFPAGFSFEDIVSCAVSMEIILGHGPLEVFFDTGKSFTRKDMISVLY